MQPRFDCQFGLRDLWTAAYSGGNGHADLAHLLPGFEHERLRVIPTLRGREALYLILKSLELPPGSKIGVPVFTCSVVARVTRAAGMVPVFIDEDSDTYGMSLPDLEKKVGRLDALVMVHTFGYPHDIDMVEQIMAGKPIIGDCAHAVGSSYKGRALGARADASLYTFGWRKPLGIGGGGCLTTANEDLAERIENQIQVSRQETGREAAAHVLGSVAYAAAFRGVLYSLMTYAFGRGDHDGGRRSSPGRTLPPERISPELHIRRTDRNLLASRIQQWHDSRRWVADFWTAVRANASPSWHIPQEPSWGGWNHFILPFRVASAVDCTGIIRQFRKRGVGAARIYPNCVAETTASGYAGDCPVAEQLSQTTFMVPAYPRMSAAARARVIESIREISRR
jgi:perosamine synthetase